MTQQSTNSQKYTGRLSPGPPIHGAKSVGYGYLCRHIMIEIDTLRDRDESVGLCLVCVNYRVVEPLRAAVLRTFGRALLYCRQRPTE